MGAEEGKDSKTGQKTYSYFMASWREGGKTRNVHLGSSVKMNAEEAMQKARKMKAERSCEDRSRTISNRITVMR